MVKLNRLFDQMFDFFARVANGDHAGQSGTHAPYDVAPFQRSQHSFPSFPIQ